MVQVLGFRGVDRGLGFSGFGIDLGFRFCGVAELSVISNNDCEGFELNQLSLQHSRRNNQLRNISKVQCSLVTSFLHHFGMQACMGEARGYRTTAWRCIGSYTSPDMGYECSSRTYNGQLTAAHEPPSSGWIDFPA